MAQFNISMLPLLICLNCILLSESVSCLETIKLTSEDINNSLLSSLLFLIGNSNGWVLIVMVFTIGTSLLLKGTEISTLLNNYLLSPKDINRDSPKKRAYKTEEQENILEQDKDHTTPSRVVKLSLYRSNSVHKHVKKVLSTPLFLSKDKNLCDNLDNLPQALKSCDNIDINDVKFYEPTTLTNTQKFTSGRYGIDLEDGQITPISREISSHVRTTIPTESTLEQFTEIYSKKSMKKQPQAPSQTPQIIQQDIQKVLGDLHTKKQNSRKIMEKELQDILKQVENENEEIRKAEQERIALIEAEKKRIALIKAEQERIAHEKLEEEKRKAAEEEEKRKAQVSTTADINVSPIKSQPSGTLPTPHDSTTPTTNPPEKSDISIVNPYTGPKKTLTVPNYTRPKTYVIAKIYIDRMEEMFASFQKRMDTQFKPEMDAAKKLINKTINRITETNQREIVREINQIMNKHKVKKDVFYFCLYFYARTIVDQAVSQTSDLKKVLPFIEVTSELMNESPEILDAVIGYIHTNCIFTIPFFPYEATDSADLKKKLGFKVEDGEMETQTQFMNRMNDIITIYAMIIQNNPPGHKYGIEKGWEWMAAFLNARPNMFTVEILDSFIRIAGYKMYQTYKLQFAKILEFIEVHILSNPPKGSDKASLSRFSDLLTNFKKAKQMPKPSFLE